MNIAAISQKRHTCKAYDSSKKISKDHIQQLCALLQNSPSSVNSQPWHFVVLSSDQAKNKILPAIADFNHNRVTDSSHTIIFCTQTSFDDQHLTHLLAQEDNDGRFANAEAKENTDKGRRYFTTLNSDTPETLRAWQEKQVYLALGTLLLGAATLDINATPIEGFDAGKMDELLGLSSKGLTSVVVATLGYKSDDDFNASLPKSRLPIEQTFTFL